MATTERLGRTLRLPMIGAPMFIVSGPELVIAQCTSGIIGAMPSLNARTAEAFADWLTQIEAALAAHDAAHPDRPSAPYAINLIIHRSNTRLQEDLEICARFRVPLVITSLGASEEVNAAVHSWGGLVFHDVTNQRFARKAVEKGADGLILIAAGAGGHGGTLSPFALVSETRSWFDGPLALGGGIATGGGILAAQAMGADFAYVGSPFIATTEATATDAQKQAMVDSAAADIVTSSHFTSLPANYIRASIAAHGLDPDNLPPSGHDSIDFSSATQARAWRDIWSAGHGIGAVTAVQSACALIEKLAVDYEAALKALGV